MSLKQYLTLMSIAFILCWLSFFMVIFFINPQEAGFLGFFLFYLSLFLALTDTFALAGFFLRIWLLDRPIFTQVIVSFRQAIWFSLFVVFCLILQSKRLLNLWVIILSILFLSFIESLFKQRNQLKGKKD